MSKKSQIAKSDDIQARADAEFDAAHSSNEVGEQSADAVTHEGDDKPAHSNLSKMQFKRTKAVAQVLFKLVPDEARFFLVDGPMFVGKQIDDKKEAATLLPVTDLDGGEQGVIIVGKVLRDLLNEQYEGDAYVNKRFEITPHRNGDKRYNTYEVYELAADE